MARLKSAYRLKENPSPEINSAEPINSASVDFPPLELPADEGTLQREPEPEPQPEPMPEAPEPLPAQPAEPQDDATAALRAQMAALDRSEEIQRQRQAMAEADQRRAAWLQNTPAARANYGALGPLHHEALRAGFDDLSEDYFRYLESGLAALEPPPSEGEPMMDDRRPPAAPAAAPAAAQPTPEFFRPPAPRMAAPRSVAVSAPVSRSIPSSDRDQIEMDPRNVRLSALEVEIAKASGISLAEYAKQKLRMQKEQRDGIRQR